MSSAMKALRVLAPATVAGLVAVAVLSVLRVQVEFAWGWALLVAAIVALMGLRFPDDPRIDAPRSPAPPDYEGSEVSRLAWAINLHTDTVNEAVTRRLRATIRRRLSRHGIDVDDEQQASAVEQMLGHGLWGRLNGRRTKVSDIRDALAAAERLAPTTHPDDSPQKENAS